MNLNRNFVSFIVSRFHHGQETSRWKMYAETICMYFSLHRNFTNSAQNDVPILNALFGPRDDAVVLAVAALTVLIPVVIH